MNISNRPIPESYWVEPNHFLAGEYPGHRPDQQLNQRIDSFLDFGINTFINLTDPNELPSYLPDLLERAAYYDIDILYKNYPIMDLGIPPVKTMVAILDQIDLALQDGRKVYVHCWGGIGRTGTTIGCYLVRHGHTGQQALARLGEWWKDVPKSRLWSHSPETEQQTQYILNWSEPEDRE